MKVRHAGCLWFRDPYLFNGVNENHPHICCCNNWMDHVSKIHGLNEKSSKISTGQNVIPNKTTLNNSKKGAPFFAQMSSLSLPCR